MTNERPLNIGLIGLGAIGQIRARAVLKSPDWNLTAAYDLDSDRAKNLSGGARFFSDEEAFWNSNAFDAVIISTPPPTHLPMARRAFSLGKHVLTEKPMAPSTADCVAMLESASEADCILGVGFNHRYFKGVQVVHDAVSSGEIGELLWLRAFAGHTGLSEFKAPWMYDKTAMGGGTLADNGVHVLDLVNYLLPDIESVTARTSNAFWKLDVEDNAFLHIASRTGVVCDFHSSWTEWKGYRFFVEAYGTRGMASMYYAPMRAAVRTIDSRGTPTATRRSFFVKDILREKASGWQSTVIETFVKELHDFRRRIDDTSLSVTAAAGADGLMARALADAAYLSSSTDSTIRVAEILVNTEIEMEPT